MPLLEVIACSVADAIAAERGGAGRLELVRALDVGGLTPPLPLVREIVKSVSIPVRVMVRENAGFELADPSELDTLCRAAREIAELQTDGLVLGFLRGRTLDVELNKHILSQAPNLKATLHRAFEELEDPESALAELKTWPQCDRILTSGAGQSWPERMRGLQQLADRASPELTVIVGAGLDAERIRLLVGNTNIREFHVGRAAR
ncbi:MAG TPA: copper homeostasis protein CutC, partial [Bryobacteraceae bacterium]|nr:copper homeostasis protein CutC [Bryobacteraceae bacterium]